MHQTTQLLTPEELANRLKVRPSTIRQWGREGLIPVVKIGAKILRFDLADVLDTLKHPGAECAAVERKAAPP